MSVSSSRALIGGIGGQFGEPGVEHAGLSVGILPKHLQTAPDPLRRLRFEGSFHGDTQSAIGGDRSCERARFERSLRLATKARHGRDGLAGGHGVDIRSHTLEIRGRSTSASGEPSQALCESLVTGSSGGATQRVTIPDECK